MYYLTSYYGIMFCWQLYLFDADLIQVYQLTEYDKTEIVRLHNEYRKQAGSSDMKLMSWDDKVAAVAEEYVK